MILFLPFHILASAARSTLMRQRSVPWILVFLLRQPPTSAYQRTSQLYIAVQQTSLEQSGLKNNHVFSSCCCGSAVGIGLALVVLLVLARLTHAPVVSCQSASRPTSLSLLISLSVLCHGKSSISISLTVSCPDVQAPESHCCSMSDQPPGILSGQ